MPDRSVRAKGSLLLERSADFIRNLPRRGWSMGPSRDAREEA